MSVANIPSRMCMRDVVVLITQDDERRLRALIDRMNAYSGGWDLDLDDDANLASIVVGCMSMGIREGEREFGLTQAREG
jgi:hypothetical protein